MRVYLVIPGEDMSRLDMSYSGVSMMVVMMTIHNRYMMMVTMTMADNYREMRSSHGGSYEEAKEESNSSFHLEN